MKMRSWAAGVIFVSSYVPLAIMLAILDFDFRKGGFATPAASYAALGLAATASLVLVGTMTVLHGDTVVTVQAAKDRSNELLNYSLPYVASFYGGGLASINFVAALLFFLGMIGWISVRTQAVLINPLLACAGYGLYDVTYRDVDGEHERTLLAKVVPVRGEALKIRALSPFLVFGEAAFQRP